MFAICEVSKERQRAAGKTTHGHRHQKDDLQVPADLPEAVDKPTRKPKSERKKNEAAEKAAAMTGASGRNVSKAKALEKEAPDLEPSANLPEVSQTKAAEMLNVSERTVRALPGDWP